MNDSDWNEWEQDAQRWLDAQQKGNWAEYPRIDVSSVLALLRERDRLREALKHIRDTSARARSAILDVLDDCWHCGVDCNWKHPWSFSTNDIRSERTNFENELRLRFADRVQQRIEELEKAGLP